MREVSATKGGIDGAIITAMTVRIQTDDFDLSAEAAQLRMADGNTGAVVSFVGTVRETGGVLCMELEHYPGMTEAAIEAMVAAARSRFGIQAATVIHRVGKLGAREQIVAVLVAARHRGAAFQACEFLMDYLKTQAPFWKKEHTATGAEWVDAREADDAALARWGVATTGNAA